MKDNTSGNPKPVDDAVFGSPDSFFDAIEDEVNGIVTDNAEPKVEATPQEADPNITKDESQEQVSDTPSDNWKKRYGDSSREAQKIRAELNELKPFVPVLEAMKKDNGLVNHVRDYFKEGGEVKKDVKKQLKLDDDFQFDADDMIGNPESDSRKVFDNMVGNIVNQKANQIMTEQNQSAKKAQETEAVEKQAVEFMKNHGMTESEFRAFAAEAQDRIRTKGITFEDMYTMYNQKDVSKNVANATKKDMLNQMKNVRDIPASVSGANNAGKANDENNSVFDALLNSDGNIEELLG